MPNLKLTIEFDGTRYAGWQYQPRHPTVQAQVESALGKILGKNVTAYGCGRTDAGVSARRYVANCHADSLLPPERLRAALNHFLPDDIRVLSVEAAPDDFHARFSAKRKTYVYRVVLATSPLRRRHSWQYRYPLDVERMRRAALLFVGRRDFQPFCQIGRKQGLPRSASSALLRGTVPAFGSGICTVLKIKVRVVDDELTVTVCGDRFLYKMVRRIVGALVAAGSGRLTQKDIRAALAGRRPAPFQTAPACGLLLDSVEY